MSTNARIGVLDPETNTVRSIYTHWDGYPEAPGNGSILLEHYCYFPEADKKVAELIELGHISSLAETIEETVAYHRDRQEPKRIDEHPHDEWPDDFGGIEWEYVFTPNAAEVGGGRWLARAVTWSEARGNGREPWDLLESVVAKAEEGEED